MKVLAKNRRASFDYQIEDRLVAGLVLSGAEAKSIKQGHISLKGSYVTIRGGEAYLVGAHVTPYNPAGRDQAADPTRDRKLLLHQRQLGELIGRKQTGLTIVPLAVLLDKRLVKIEIGLGRGKKHFDKRAAIKKRELQREVNRAVRP